MVICTSLKCSSPWISIYVPYVITAQLKIEKNNPSRVFPGGPVVGILCLHCRGHGFHPWSGNKDPTSYPVQLNIKKRGREREL